MNHISFRFGNGSARIASVGLAVVFLFTLTRLEAQPDDTAVGRWKGAIEVPNAPLEVIVSLEHAPGTAYTGTIDIPAQGIKALALKDVVVNGRSVGFVITSVPGEPTFAGTIATDGVTMSGDFRQGGATLPFTLRRETAAAREEAARATAAALADIRTLASDVLKRFNVPGMSIAIVRHGEVIFTEGFGVRDAEKKLPVTAGTLFAIGSSTKAFTSLVLGTLADEGKLDWAKPVRQYLPEFQLKDPFATEHMTPRDLCTHVSGLPRHDVMWYGSSLSRQELFDRLRYLEPSEDFRAKWQYQNLMYMTAGYMAGRIAGTTWEDLVRRRIFEPLGMSASSLSVVDMERAPDAALPYEEHEHDGKKVLERVPYRVIDAVGPAGSINSNAIDMAKWVQLHLGDGTVNGKRVISQEELEGLHRARIVMSDKTSTEYKELLFTLYASGWMVQSFRGHRLIHHGGNIDGFSALVSFMPDDDIGLVILTNRGGTPGTVAMMLATYDRLMDFEKVDWIARVLKSTGGEQKEDDGDEAKPAEAARVTGTKPSHPLKDYVGEFEHPAYGVMEIQQSGDGLRATYHGMSAPVEHFHYDVFVTKTPDSPIDGMKLQFEGNLAGDIDQVQVPLEPAVEPIRFTRRAPPELSRPDVLAGYVGEYELKDVTVKVALKGTVLAVKVPGQPTYTLVPYREGQFTLKGLSGYSVRFTTVKGVVSGVSFVQPNGVFEAKRKK